MKIAIITSGILPVPAVQGGAVENLIDYVLEYNDQHHLHDITVYSTYCKRVLEHPALQSSVNHYKYVKTHSIFFRLFAKYGENAVTVLQLVEIVRLKMLLWCTMHA